MDRPHLLIVDDEQGVRSSLSLLLEEEGYDVETAEGADAALAHVRREPFNLVLCDVRMPGRDGLELLPELLDLQPDLSVVMMSAYGALDQALEGGTGFIEVHGEVPPLAWPTLHATGVPLSRASWAPERRSVLRT